MLRRMQYLSLSLMAAMILWSPIRSASAGEDSTAKKPAVVIVRLPAEAELVIGGFKSKQKTPVREFDTPPLAPGKKFAYRIRAVWKDGGKEVKRQTTIIVRAGETTEINLRNPTLSAPAAEKNTAPKFVMPEMDRNAKPKDYQTKPLSGGRQPPEYSQTRGADAPRSGVLAVPKKTQGADAPRSGVLPAPPKPEPEKKTETKAEPIKKSSSKPERIKKTPKPKPSTRSSKREPPSAPPKIVSEASSPKGALALLMPDTLTLQPGGAKLLPIKIVRTHFAEPVRITFEGLPPGIDVKETTVTADKQKIYVRLAAPTEAEEKEWVVKVIGVSGIIRQDSALKIKIAK